MHPKYRADIDGLRAFAVLSVLIYHLNNNWLVGGFVGVDIFFVISGFLITQIIVKEMHSETFSFTNFYARRVRCIFPALFVVLAVSAFLVYLLFPKAELLSFSRDLKFASLQVANFRFAQTVEYSNLGLMPSPLLHTWSLGVEEQFYLLWPLLILLSLKLWGEKSLLPIMVILTVCSVVLSQALLVFGETKQAYYMVYSRFFELSIGGVVAMLKGSSLHHRRGNILSFIGLALLMSSLFVIHKQTLFPGVWALMPVLGAALVLYAAKVSKVCVSNRLLSFKPLVHVGKISYSLYLWHWVVITFCLYIVDLQEMPVSYGIVCAGLSYVLAYLSYHFVETPFRKKRYQNLRSNLKVVLVGLLLMGVGVFVGQQVRLQKDGIGRNFTDPVYQRAFSMHKKHDDCRQLIEDGYDTQKLDVCSVGGNSTDGMDVLLIGDSHASHYFPALKGAWFDEKGRSRGVIFFSGALLMDGIYRVYDFKEKDFFNASGIVEKIVADIKQGQQKVPEYILLAQRFDFFFDGQRTLSVQGQNPYEQTYNLQNMLTLMRQTVDIYRSLGSKVVILGQVPHYSKEPSKCYERSYGLPLSKWLFTDLLESCLEGIHPLHFSEEEAFIAEMNKMATEKEGVYFFNPRAFIPSFTNPEDGTILYYDDDHLNEDGATFLAPYLDQFMAEIDGADGQGSRK